MARKTQELEELEDLLVADPDVEEPEEEQDEVEEEPTARQGKGGKPKGKRSVREERIEIPELIVHGVTLPLVARAPLITNHFSNKAKEQIRKKQQQIATEKKAAKDPERDFLDALYIADGCKPKVTKRRDGAVVAAGEFQMVANAFKLSMVSACRCVDRLPMTKALLAFHVADEFVTILGPNGKPAEAVMREDAVRLNAGPRPVADLRYRPMFRDWRVNLRLVFNPRMISHQQLAHLAQHAGFAVGVGEWRPEKKGIFGRYQIDAKRLSDTPEVV